MLMLKLYLFSGQVTALQGFVAVDGDVFNWVGAAAGPSLATQTSAEYTSTKTVFTFNVNSKVTLTATFLSPVYPNDLVKQSLQFSYIDVAVVSSDGAAHDVQIYLDCTGGETSLVPHAISQVPMERLTRICQSGRVVVTQRSSWSGAMGLSTVWLTTPSTLPTSGHSPKSTNKRLGELGFWLLPMLLA